MDTIKFCTGSEYTGSLESIDQRMMNGFGTYTYPDGSIYRGNFRAGHFNGEGRLRLAAPYNMTYTGTFVDGRLTKIYGMTFNDGLRFYKHNRVDESYGNALKNWKYCTTGERRYFSELFDGLTPMANETHSSTAEAGTRYLSNGFYDTEEGLYWPVSGFLNSIKPPSPAIRFVDSVKETEWIKTHCRYGGNTFANCERTNIGIPLHPICPEIIKNNVLAMQETEREEKRLIKDACACTLKHLNLKHLKLCEDLLRTPFDDASSADRAECFLTESNSSFGMDSLNLSLTRNRIARVCTTESSMESLKQEQESESNIFPSDVQDQNYTSFTASESTEEATEKTEEQEEDNEEAAEVAADDADKVSRVRFKSQKNPYKTLL